MIKTLRSILRGSGQVMFQKSALSGLLFLAGIFWGSYQNHTPAVAYGAMVGLVASTIAGWIVAESASDRSEGDDGLWGFNGILVGCAFPTFLGSTWQMWTALIFCSMLTTWVRTGFNKVMSQWNVNSLTFPFVCLTWTFLFAARMLSGLAPDALSEPPLSVDLTAILDTSFLNLEIYWLKGLSQVFLIDSWVTGALFLAGLAVCSIKAAVWGAAASAISLGVAISFGADSTAISLGLYGFSPVLTGIALGSVFHSSGVKNCIWTIAGIVATVFIQAGMNAMFAPFGLPTLTAPFCVTTWLFLLPQYQFQRKHPDA